MIYVFLASGFEEIEALAAVDILRRAELDVVTVGVGEKVVTGSHKIPVYCDVMDCEIYPDENCTGVVLPGGIPGALNLEKSQIVQSFIDYANDNNILIAAICAAPSILGHKGLLKGKKAVCFTGFEEQLLGAEIQQSAVYRDGNIITACGAGAAIKFGLELVKAYCGIDEKNRLEAAMLCDR
ncbi:MAG: DJ-1/PfpI family protein [Oscillospiraceae bacterium]|nr:DJ-1/PfpI family protein [Oscillospiraceae bacterium]